MNTYTAREIATILQNEGDEKATLRMVRYYTQIGLVPALAFVENKRVYTDVHLDTFRAIRTLNKTGKTLSAIQEELHTLSPDNIKKIASVRKRYTKENLYKQMERHEVTISNDVSVSFSSSVDPDTCSKVIAAVRRILKGE
jgi:DNA-binding transcriptional MerR regulator